MDVSAAIESGRVHDQLYPLQVDADEIVPDAVLNTLIERGHNITGMSSVVIIDEKENFFDSRAVVTVSDMSRVAAVVQAVVRKNGKIFGMWCFDVILV